MKRLEEQHKEELAQLEDRCGITHLRSSHASASHFVTVLKVHADKRRWIEMITKTIVMFFCDL